MDLLVHVIDPIDRDEVLLAARFRIVLAQYDTVGGLQVVDRANVFAVQAHNFHVLLNAQTFEHIAPPLLPRKNALRAKEVPDPVPKSPTAMPTANRRSSRNTRSRKKADRFCASGSHVQK